MLFLSYTTIMRSRSLCYFCQLPDDRGHGAIYFYSNYHAMAATVPLFIFFHLPYHCEHWSLSFISPSNYHTIVVLTTIRCGHSDISLFLSPATMRSHLRSLPLSIHYHTITVRAFFKLNRILKSHTFTFSSWITRRAGAFEGGYVYWTGTMYTRVTGTRGICKDKSHHFKYFKIYMLLHRY